LRVHRHLDKVSDDAKAFTWIYQIATNICLTAIRDRKPVADVPVDLPAKGAGIEELLANRDLATRAIASAPEKLRLPAWLHFVEELDYVAVARILGVSRRTVINRVQAFTELARVFLEGQK
jgi:RNA polymerase sigma-70 factor, ECF subfamily